jgi:hypothetical protein
LIEIEGLEEIHDEGMMKGHKWAKPSRSSLQRLMRHVVTHPEEARKIGMNARKSIVENYSLKKVAQLVVEHLKESFH